MSNKAKGKMRDTYLNINQKNAIALKNKFLDGKGESLIKTEDLILLRRIQDFAASSKTVQVVVENEIFSWVHYETIQLDLPMIFPSIKSLKKRVERLKEIGLIINKSYIVTKKMLSKGGFEKAGRFSVIQLSRECKTLFDFPNMEELSVNQDIEEETEGLPLGGVKGKPLGGVKGKPLGGVKGKPLGGVKGKPLGGVNKEYLEINTEKVSMLHVDMPHSTNEKGFKPKDSWEQFLMDNTPGIHYQPQIEKAIKDLLKRNTVKQVESYLLETYVNGLEKNLTVKEIAGIIIKGDRIVTTKKVEKKKTEIVPMKKRYEDSGEGTDNTEKFEDLKPEDEIKARNILINEQKFNPNVLDAMKRKSNKTYQASLRRVLREVV